jgi:PhnB protein
MCLGRAGGGARGRLLHGNLDLKTVDKQGVLKPAGPGDTIMLGRLEADGVVITASDGHPDYPAKVGHNMGIALGGMDKDRLTRIFSGLGEGGKIKMPLARQSWGADVGWLTDKFGITWMVSIDKA